VLLRLAKPLPASIPVSSSNHPCADILHSHSPRPLTVPLPRRNLEPGGWLEIQDYGLPVKSADDTHLGTDLLRWGELLCEAARQLGRPMGSDVSDRYVAWMEEAGFVDIEQRMFMWPSNAWPKDPFMKELGRWNQINILDGLEGFCLALLTRGLGWRKEEVDVFVARVARDLRDRKIHAYFPMPVTFGRKPFPHEVGFH